jgi:hypothetical protein
MKKTIVFLKITGLIVLAIGFVIPWYIWGIELVGDRVIVNIFNLSLSDQAFGDPFDGSVNKLGVWQLIVPRSLVTDMPLMRGSYLAIEGITPTDVIENIGIKWAIVPALTLLLFIIVLVLSVVRIRGMSLLLKESLTPLLFGTCIMLLVLLWTPVPPESLKGFKPTPSLGKYVTILGALLLTINGFVNLSVKRSALQAEKQASITRTGQSKQNLQSPKVSESKTMADILGYGGHVKGVDGLRSIVVDTSVTARMASARCPAYRDGQCVNPRTQKSTGPCSWNPDNWVSCNVAQLHSMWK